MSRKIDDIRALCVLLCRIINGRAISSHKGDITMRYPKGTLIDMFHGIISTLRRRMDTSKHSRLFDLLEGAEERVVENADRLGWHYDCMENYVPFVPVLPQESFPFTERVAMVRDQSGEKPGVLDLDPEGFHDFTLPLSRSDPYFLMGVFFWRDTRVAGTPDEARQVIRIQSRWGLSTNEMLSLALHGFHYAIERSNQPTIICALGSMYSGHKHNPLHEFQVPALYLHPEAPEGPRLSSCSSTRAPGPIVYMPFCIERMELTG